MKNKSSASQFPSIYRRITEFSIFKNFKKNKFGLLWQSKLKKPTIMFLAFLVFLLVVVMAFWIAVFSIRIYRYYAYFRSISVQRQAIVAKINFWKSVVDKYDGYKDAYFQMAVLEYQLGDIAKAKQDDQTALLLDPNFTDARKLEVVLEKQ